MGPFSLDEVRPGNKLMPVRPLFIWAMAGLSVDHQSCDKKAIIDTLILGIVHEYRRDAFGSNPWKAPGHQVILGWLMAAA